MTPVCQSAGTGEGWFSTRAQIVAMSCACAGATAFLYAVDPNRHAVYPQCLFYNLTGLYCAGCGATRACHALLHGRVVEALHDNALFVGVLPFVLFLAGTLFWVGWILWGLFLLIPAMRHPSVPLDPEMNRGRLVLGVIGILIFALTFTPTPFYENSLMHFFHMDPFNIAPL